jgi:hypothetical protein
MADYAALIRPMELLEEPPCCGSTNWAPSLGVAIVECELAWAPHLLSTMDHTYRERHGEAIYRFKGLPSRRRGTACCRATSSTAASS